MSFFNNIYNKKESFYLRIKWSIIIILSLLFLTGIAYFFYFIFSPADSNQMKEIKDSWVFYTKDDPDFKFGDSPDNLSVGIKSFRLDIQ